METSKEDIVSQSKESLGSGTGKISRRKILGGIKRGKDKAPGFCPHSHLLHNTKEPNQK